MIDFMGDPRKTRTTALLRRLTPRRVRTALHAPPLAGIAFSAGWLSKVLPLCKLEESYAAVTVFPAITHVLVTYEIYMHRNITNICQIFSL